MSNHHILNRFFSKATLLEIINNENNSCYGEIIKRYSLDETGTNQELLSSIYSILSKQYRNEYFYKNSLLNKLIINKHKLYSTKVLTEFSIGKSIADFVTLNGDARVYEIKTELDNLERIESQIEDYYKCFPYVCVVTCKTHLEKIKRLFKNTSVGIYYFSDRNALKPIQEPAPNYGALDYEVMFKVLRKYEFEQVIQDYYQMLPNTTQFKYYGECFDLFNKIDKNILYKKILSVLKNRCSIEIEQFEKVPIELKMLVYQAKLGKSQYDKLYKFLDSTYINQGGINVFSVFER